MKKLYLLVRCGILWAVSLLHFTLGTAVLLLAAVFVDPRKYDWLPRFIARNIVRLAGAKLRVQPAPGFDRQRTCIFISNHVNLFDPFVLYSSIPQYIRGWELESHFRIPVYGWLMKRYGNVPVADQIMGYPIVPVSLVGSFEFNHKGSHMLFPSTIVVYLHDTIETTQLSKKEIENLLGRVQQIVSRPIEEALAARAEG